MLNKYKDIIYKLSILFKEIKLNIDNKKYINNINYFINIKSKYIGKKSLINKYIKYIPKIEDIKYKIIIGKLLNNIKIKVKKKIDNIIKKIKSNIIINNDNMLLPGIKKNIGSLHPISILIKKIEFFFIKYGYDIFITNDIENYNYNFKLLNINKHHPSFSDKDTFWINNFLLLRTHITPIQIRYSNINKIPPIRIISYGRVYRNDNDKTHLPIFNQIDGFYINENINIVELKSILINFLKYIFGNLNIKIRLRQGYFPFTEPSIEFDIYFNKKWFEILGCGLINNKILSNMGIDYNKYNGYAFGIGLERIIMIKYNINNIKDIFNNDIRLLDKFKYL